MIGEAASFDEYQAHRGELTSAQFEAVKVAHYTQEEYGEVFMEIGRLGVGLPDAAQADILARIHKMYPNRHSMWKLAESYLILGRW